MLSELNTSHTHFYTKLEPAYYQLLGILMLVLEGNKKSFFLMEK